MLFRSAIRITALLRDAVMERKTLKAEKNASMPVGGEVSAWFRLLVKFAPPVMFAIGLVTVRKLNLAVKSTLKSEKSLQLVTNNGLIILYVTDDVSLMDYALTC